MKSVVVTGGAMLIEDAFYSPLINKEEYPFPIYRLSEVDFSALLGSRGLKYLTQATKMSLAASIFAIEHSALKEIHPVRSGVVLATNMASIATLSEFDLITLRKGANCVSPMQGPNLLLNAPTARLGIHHKISGFNTTISSGRVAAIDALEYAYHAISNDEVDLCIVTATEENSSECERWFAEAGMPAAAGVERVSESAGVLILESESCAQKRNPRIYGRLKGFKSIFEPDYLLGNGNIDTLDSGYASLSENCENVHSVCVSNNIYCHSYQEEKKIIQKYFKGANIINYSEVFCGELYGASGIAQTIHALSVFDKYDGVVLGYDWFGNFRAMQLERSA